MYEVAFSTGRSQIINLPVVVFHKHSACGSPTHSASWCVALLVVNRMAACHATTTCNAMCPPLCLTEHRALVTMRVSPKEAHCDSLASAR